MMGTSVNHHDAEIELQALKIELVAFESGCLKTLGHRLSKGDCSKKHPDMMLKYKRFSKLKMLTNTNATTKSKFQTERGVIKSTSTPPGNVSDTTEVNKSRNTMSTRVVRVKSADTTAKHKVEDKGSHTSGKFGSKLNKKIKDAASYKPKKGRPLNVRGLSFKSSVNLGAVEPESDASIAGQKSVRPQSIEHTTSSNTRKATTMPLPTKGTTSPGAGKSANSLADTSRTLLNEQAHARGQSGTSTSDPSHADSMVGTVEHPVPFKAEQVLLSAMNTVEMMPAYQAHTRQAQRHTQTHACAPTLDSAVRVPGGVRVGVDTTARAENPHTNAVGSVDGGVVVAHGGGGALRSGLTASAPLSFGKTADVRRRSSHFKNVVQNDTKRKAEQAQRQKEREEFAAMFDLHEGQARDGNDAGVYTADGALGTTSGARDLRGKAEVDYMLDGEAVDQSQWTTLGEETDLPIKQAEDASGKDKKPAKSYNIKSAQVSNNFVRMDLKKNFRRGAQGITPAFMANKAFQKKFGNSKTNQQWKSGKWKGSAGRNLAPTENFNSSDDEAYLGQNGPQMQVHLRTRDTGTSNAVYETQNFNSIKPVTETVEIGLDEVKIPSLAVRDDQAPLRFFDELEPLPQSQSHLAHALDMEGMQDSDTGHRGNRNAAISLDMKGCADIREDGSDGGSVGDEKRSCVDTDEKQNMGSVKGKRTLTDETPREVECSGCLSALDMEGRNLHLKAKGQSSTGLSEDTTYPSIDTKESPIDQAKPAADSTELPNNKRTSRTERASTGEKPIKRVKRISSAGERHESQSCTGEEYENSGTECSTKSTEQSINRPSRGARKGTATTHTDEMASPDTASCRKSVRKNTRTQTSKQANTDSDISSDMDAPKKKGRRVPQASAQDMCTRTRTRSRMKEASPSKPQTSMRVTRARRACVQTTVTETTGTQRRTSWAQDVSGSSGEDRDGGGTDSSSDYGDIDDVDYTCALREGLGDSGDDTEVSSGGASEVGSSSEGTEGKVLKGRVHGRKPQRSNFKSSESDADTDGIGGGGKSTCRSVGGARKGTKGRRKVTTRRQDTAAVNGDVNSSARPTTAAPTKQRKKTLRPEDIQRLAENPAHALKYVYGFDTFRPGQELAVSRICKGQATLVVQPTGSGKSLCYQLPAFIQALESPSLCLVVCPLVSLMHDQVKRLPKAIPGACLNSTQTQKTKKKIIADIRKGVYKVLYVSPELVVTKNFADLVHGKEWVKGQRVECAPFPKIGFVCVDEAHCVSEWSHNFRPAYLRLGLVLCETLGVTNILALTATATIATLNSVMKCFAISPSGVIRGVMVPRNLSLAVSYENRKEHAIIALLSLPQYQGPVVIYCTRQWETEKIANIVRNSGLEAEAYHAGLSDRERKRVQFKFMSDKLRIICCTIAFGMGLDKPNIRGVIHYNMPKSIENYVQEVGRAGRDGAASYCHMLLSKSDIWWLRSRAHADTVDSNTLLRFITEVFSLDEASADAGTVGLLSIDDLEQKYDMRETALFTLLCKLEMHSHKFISVLPQMNCICTLRVSKAQLEEVATTNMFAKAVLSVGSLNLSGASYNVRVRDLAEKLGADVQKVPQWLRDLAFGNRMGIDFSDRAFAYKINIRPNRAQTGDIHRHLLHCMGTLEHCGRRKVEVMYGVMEKASLPEGKVGNLYTDTVGAYTSATAGEMGHTARLAMSDNIRNMCALYFQSVAELKTTDGTDEVVPAVDVFANALQIAELQLTDKDREYMAQVLRTFIGRHSKYVKSGRAVARIFHGIDSPCHQASHWRGQPDWGKYTHIDFNVLCSMAVEEITKQKRGER